MSGKNGFPEEVAPELILQESLMAGAIQGKGLGKVWWEHRGWCFQRPGAPSGLEGVWEMKLVGEDWPPLAVRTRSVVHVDGRWEPLSILARDCVLLQSSLTPTSHLTADRLEASASPWCLGKGRAKSKKTSPRRHPET